MLWVIPSYGSFKVVQRKAMAIWNPVQGTVWDHKDFDKEGAVRGPMPSFLFMNNTWRFYD